MSATLTLLLVTVASLAQTSPAPLPKQELDYQRQAFQQWWGTELELHLDQLPADQIAPAP